jgi:hypothetical protein
MSEASTPPSDDVQDLLWCTLYAAAFIKHSRTSGHTDDSDREAARISVERANRGCRALASIEPPFPPSDEPNARTNEQKPSGEGNASAAPEGAS